MTIMTAKIMGRMHHRAELEALDRHLKDAEAIVLRQQGIVAELAQGGHPVTAATALLKEFETALETERAHRSLIVMAMRQEMRQENPNF